MKASERDKPNSAEAECLLLVYRSIAPSISFQALWFLEVSQRVRGLWRAGVSTSLSNHNMHAISGHKNHHSPQELWVQLWKTIPFSYTFPSQHSSNQDISYSSTKKCTQIQLLLSLYTNIQVQCHAAERQRYESSNETVTVSNLKVSGENVCCYLFIYWDLSTSMFRCGMFRRACSLLKLIKGEMKNSKLLSFR